MPPNFALDQNFPQSILAALGYIPEVILTPLQQIDPRLTANTEDWEILVALSRAGFDGFISGDSAMVQLPKELSVLIQTKLTLVVTESVTHDALEATGLLLIHLRHIAHQTDPNIAQLWKLRLPRRHSHTDPWEQLKEVAARQKTTAKALFASERLPSGDL